MTDRFDGIVPGRRGTGQPARPNFDDPEVSAIERARGLVEELNDRGAHGDYWVREELYAGAFRHLLDGYKLEAGEGWQLMQPTNEDRGIVWELHGAEGGPVCGLLMLRWENGPFASLLVNDPGD